MSRSPAAFFSYVRFVDQHEEGRVTSLCKRLEGEIRVYLGDEFSIFQDREIGWGDEWKRRIDQALDASTFFIPVLTPAFFRSPYCRGELETFLEREKKLGRRDLILPIYYVDTPLFNDTARRAADPLAEVLASRQYTDWRNLRFEPWTDPQVSRRLSEMAIQVRDALDEVRPFAKTAVSSGSRPEAKGTVPVTSDKGAAASSQALKEPPTHIVDPLHRGHFTTISAAIAAAKPGDRILVRPGFYPEGLVMEKPLEILGDGPREEIVVEAKGKSVLLFRTTMGRVKNLTLRLLGDANLNGVDISKGRLELEDCDISSQGSSCVGIYNYADPRLRRNRIHHGKHSGVFIYDHGQGTFEDNEIFGNSLAGIVIKEGGNPVVRKNRIHDNQDNGIFVYENGQGTFEDNEIFGNLFSGIETKAGGNPVMRKNRIHDNQAAGIFINENGQGTFEDNEIFGNLLSGIETKADGNPVVRKNRIHDNQQDGIFINENGQGIFEDNEISANSMRGVEIRSGGNPVLWRNRILNNAYTAIWIAEGGGGTFEKNDLRGSPQGSWEIDPECEKQVKRSGNLE